MCRPPLPGYPVYRNRFMSRIDAQNMRAIANNITTSKNALQLQDILEKISVAAKNGKLDMSYTSTIYEPVKLELLQRGFKCKYNAGYDQRDGSYTTIEW